VGVGVGVCVGKCVCVCACERVCERVCERESVFMRERERALNHSVSFSCSLVRGGLDGGTHS